MRQIGLDIAKIGEPSTGQNKQLLFENSGGTSQRGFRYNEAQGYLEFTDDGSTWTRFGTPVGGFTEGSVLFADNSGGIAENNAAFFVDPTLQRLGVNNSTPSASIDVKSLDGLSSTKIFSASNPTTEWLQILGDGKINVMPTASMWFSQGGTRPSRIEAVTANNATAVNFNLSGARLTDVLRCQNQKLLRINVASIGASSDSTSAGAGFLEFQNSASQPLGASDKCHMYAADIVAGNSAPHFRTESGQTIKLYSENTSITPEPFVANTSMILNDSATWGGYTIGQVVAALKQFGLLA